MPVTPLLTASGLVWGIAWVDYWIEGGAIGGIPYPWLVGLLLVLNLVVTRRCPRYKRLVVRFVQARLVNPVVRVLLRARIPVGWCLLETTGRRTGRRRETPVGNGLVGDVLWIVAEHGGRAGYVRNLRATPRVRVLVRSRGLTMTWREGVAQVLPDDDPIRRQRLLGGWRHPLRALNATFVRILGTELLTVRVDLDPDPGRPASRVRRPADAAATSAGVGG